MENVLDVYERPYDEDNPVINLDESPKQLIGEKKNSFTDSKGIKYEDFEYERKGVVDIYMIAEPKAGKRKVLIKDDHKSKTYAHVIRHIAEEMYPPEKYSLITIVEDNLSSHKLSTLYEIMSPEEAREIIRRIEIVRTPPHGSWLNIAELELSLLTRIGLDNRIDTKEMLERKVKDWYQMRNDKIAKVNWTFTSKDARIKLKRLYPSFET